MLGVIGVGQMGVHVARHLAAADAEGVLVFDADREALARACSHQGVRAADSAADLASRCECVITMLPTGEIVEQVVTAVQAVLQPGMVLIDMSTSHPQLSRSLAARLEQTGAGFADAPVSGGIYAARAGKLTIYLGAEAETAARARRILTPTAKQIFHVGPVGCGHVMKVLNNMVSMATLVLTTEAVALGRRQGLAPERIVECLNAGSARSYATEVKYPRAILTHTYDTLGPMRMLYKDVNIALDLADASRVATPTCHAATELWKVAMAELGETADQTEIYRFFCRLYGLEE